MIQIKELISEKNWTFITSHYSVKEICSLLSFREVMHLVNHLFYDNIQSDENQQFALKLAFEVKEYFKNEWDADWKNDVFLGGLCDMLWLYNERYLCYKRAYDKLKDAPQELLLLLSNCNSAPGTPPITDNEAEFYLHKALEKKLTFEVALKMRSLYRQKEDKSKEEYWDQIYRKLEKENVHSNQIIPDVLL